MNTTRSPSDIPNSARHVGLAWLVRLRWGATFGQLFIVVFASRVLDASLLIGALLSLIAVTLFSNVVCAWGMARRGWSSPKLIAGLLVLDSGLLTALLFLSGGAGNPFSVFYLVHVALAALLLGPRGVWLLAALTSVGFGFLFLQTSSMTGHDHGSGHGSYANHLRGMWAAYTLAAGFVAYFVYKVAAALRDRERQLAEWQRYAANAEKLASLSTLAAGAAHELGTPLATIAVVAKELERAVSQAAPTETIQEDARLIRQEVERCREILRQMGAQAGESAGEAPMEVSLSDLLGSLRDALGRDKGGALQVEDVRIQPSIVAPPRALVQVLINLLRNAFDAHAEAGSTQAVRLRIDAADHCVTFSVYDRGPGMTEEVLARVGEPFFTTKESGRGMGLGVFLAKAFAEKLGGHLELSSSVGAGTCASLRIPQDSRRRTLA